MSYREGILVAVKFHRMLPERPEEILKNLQKKLFQKRMGANHHHLHHLSQIRPPNYRNHNMWSLVSNMLPLHLRISVGLSTNSPHRIIPTNLSSILRDLDLIELMIVFNGFQVCIHESRVESKSNSTFDDHPSSGLGSPCAIYVIELDIPSVMENDGIVLEYAMDKELEDVDSIINEYQYLRVATGHLKESLDEIVEELRRQDGTTCLCFSFAGFALLAIDSRVTGPDMLTVSKITVVNSSLQTKICRCGDLYESFVLIEDKEGKMEHKRSHNRVVRACKDFNKHQKFMLCLHRPWRSTSGESYEQLYEALGGTDHLYIVDCTVSKSTNLVLN